jgi:ArsR family transcriptional regulator
VSVEEELYLDAAEIELDEDELIEMAELFKMFGDSTRIKILSVLFGGERCVQEITEAICASQSAVSHQLRLLKQARLVRCRRSGKQIYYSLADDHVGDIIEKALEHIRE